MIHKSRNEDEVERAVAENLVSDVNGSALGVLSFGHSLHGWAGTAASCAQLSHGAGSRILRPRGGPSGGRACWRGPARIARMLFCQEIGSRRSARSECLTGSQDGVVLGHDLIRVLHDGLVEGGEHFVEVAGLDNVLGESRVVGFV